MEQRLSVVTIGVENLERARRFYENLGWSAEFADENIVFFQLDGLIFALFGRRELAEDMGTVEPHLSGGFALAYNVRERTDVDTILTTLAVTAGATILQPAREASWGGYTGYFVDLDGHPWEIAWNPNWILDADGRISLKEMSQDDQQRIKVL
jgi:uncharacterized protein